jgi:hypothetical protein
VREVKQLLDPEGNPDTSFLAKIPADVPFTFQTLDRDGLVLNMSQTWHQVRPGEVRHNCGGCHAHAQKGLDFSLTKAASDDYAITDLTSAATLLTRVDGDKLAAKAQDRRAVDVEYYRDIKPILQRSCIKCHSGDDAKAGLVLDDEEIVGGYENTWHRLANDSRAKYGRKPVIRNGAWRQTNASRYVRKFQSRRSLLAWKVFGRRLDGWSNEDHPTESVPGDASTLPEGANPNDADIDFIGTIMPPPKSGVPPLSDDEKLTIARWIDLGCPITRDEDGYRERGWFLDELRPTMTIASPQPGRNDSLDRIVIGLHDYYSGLDESSLTIVADTAIAAVDAGEDLAPRFEKTHTGVWQWKLKRPMSDLQDATLTVTVRDRQGNTTKLRRSFSIGSSSGKRTASLR